MLVQIEDKAKNQGKNQQSALAQQAEQQQPWELDQERSMLNQPLQAQDKANEVPSKALLSLTAQAIHQYALIQENDRLAVGYSGGKDSLALIAILNQLQKRSDIPRFDFTVIHLDQHQPNFQRELFWQNIKVLGVDCTVISKDTWSVVEKQLKPGQIPCSVCGRLRRGILNRWCQENGYNKLALGHHLDDAIETFFLNLLFGRKLNPLKPSTPAPKQQVTTIRPMILIEERKIKDWVEKTALSPVPCPVCDSYPDAKRRDLKQLMDQFRTLQSDVHSSMRSAIYDQPERLSMLAQGFDEELED